MTDIFKSGLGAVGVGQKREFVVTVSVSAHVLFMEKNNKVIY